MNQKTIKLSDIAKRLNYSETTVSKALRNHIDIPIQTAKLIRSTAEKMGYFPNIIARNLSVGKSNMIGIIFPKIVDKFLSDLAEYLYDLAYYNNYSLVLMVSQENEARERKHLETLLSMKVDGIIISLSQDTEDYRIFNKAKSRNIPIVFVNKIPQINGVLTTLLPYNNTTSRISENAIKLGYCNIVWAKEFSTMENLFELFFTTLKT